MTRIGTKFRRVKTKMKTRHRKSGARRRNAFSISGYLIHSGLLHPDFIIFSICLFFRLKNARTVIEKMASDLGQPWAMAHFLFADKNWQQGNFKCFESTKNIKYRCNFFLVCPSVIRNELFVLEYSKAYRTMHTFCIIQGYIRLKSPK